MTAVDALVLLMAATAAVLAAALWRRERELRRIARSILAPSLEGAAVERRLREIVEAARVAELRRADATSDLAVLVDSLELAVVRTDDRLVIVAATEAAGRIAGRLRAEMIGRTLIEAFVEPRVEHLARLAVGGATVAEEILSPSPDGSAFQLRAARASSGGAWIVLEDTAELRRLRRIRTEFVDNLSHELRTPVTTIGLLVEALGADVTRAEPAIPVAMRRRIDKIEVETGHLAQMVNELLDLARIESGKVVPTAEPFDLAELARVSVERLGPFAAESSVALEAWAAADLPPARGDAVRIGQVITNLVHNAVKFSRPGGPVTVDVAAEGGELIVSVRDEGIGIAPEDQARIFERFYKVDRARVRGGGTGLGLSIAKHIVEANGGRIWIESRHGHGSTFRFSLPIASQVTQPGGPA